MSLSRVQVRGSRLGAWYAAAAELGEFRPDLNVSLVVGPCTCGFHLCPVQREAIIRME